MQRDACTLVDPAPRVNPSVLADGRDGTVWAEILKDPAKDLFIEIDKWNLGPPDGDFDTLYVYHQNGSSGLKEEIFSEQYAAGDADKFPVSIRLDKHAQSYLADGDHLFFYEVLLYYGELQPPSDTLTLRFDRMGPNNGLPPKEVPPLPVITDVNVGSIELTLPESSDRAEGDHAYWWISKEIPEGVPTLPPEGDAPVTQADQKLPVRKATLEALGDGTAWVVYLLIDKAGNMGSDCQRQRRQQSPGHDSLEPDVVIKDAKRHGAITSIWRPLCRSGRSWRMKCAKLRLYFRY
ncbi:hypothetical protein [Pseudomonas inefficax]|uniref:hypothetical protein n=1 Tax=Pseudomonas inefficax TaxID=2078786 RepID=UPI0035C5CECB